MTELYQTTSDENIKLLAQTFLERAGDDWLKNAEKSNSSVGSMIQKLTTRNVSQEPKPDVSIPDQARPSKSKRIYRGQVVED